MKCFSGFLRFIGPALITTASLCVASAQSSQKPVDLGTLGGTYSVGNAIRLFDTVAGASTLSGDTATHAFFYSKGKLQDLGVLSGGSNSYGNGLNLHGEVAGTSDYDDPINGIVQHAFLYKSGAINDLGTLGGAISQGSDIDERGNVVGYSLLADEATTHAFYYKAGNSYLTDLGTVGTGINSQAYGINRGGTLVAGSSDTGKTDSLGNIITDAAIWDLQKHTVKDVGNLGSYPARLLAINDFGFAVGDSSTSTGNTDALVYFGGKLKDIGTLGGSYSSATAVNELGVVVGLSNITGDTAVHAFVWTPSKGIIDLNSLLPANSGWELSAAYGINLEGDVVGIGIINGESHAFKFSLFPGGHCRF